MFPQVGSELLPQVQASQGLVHEWWENGAWDGPVCWQRCTGVVMSFEQWLRERDRGYQRSKWDLSLGGSVLDEEELGNPGGAQSRAGLGIWSGPPWVPPSQGVPGTSSWQERADLELAGGTIAHLATANRWTQLSRSVSHKLRNL